MLKTKSFLVVLVLGLLASLSLAQFDEGGCDGFGSVFDDCGVCGGNNDCLKEKTKTWFVEEESEQREERDLLWGCDNEGGLYDLCGVCNGDSNSCRDCEGALFGHKRYDQCGICDGQNLCFTCDGMGGYYDKCGICNGNGTTCGGCDGLGGDYDGCGICAGDDSTCSCVYYHGFKLTDLDYLLVQYLIDQTLWKIQQIMDTLILTMEDLEEYSGPADLGHMIQYLNNFCENCLSEYSLNLDEFAYSVKQSIGLIDDLTPFNRTHPYKF